MGGYDYIPIPPAAASCIIAHLFVELMLPCQCPEDGTIVILGTAYDGSEAKITIKGEEVKFYGEQRTLETIRTDQCRAATLRP